jgi:hypothetical protein
MFPLFWVVTQRVLVDVYQRFVGAYRSHLQGSFWPLAFEDETGRLSRNLGKQLRNSLF